MTTIFDVGTRRRRRCAIRGVISFLTLWIVSGVGGAPHAAAAAAQATITTNSVKTGESDGGDLIADAIRAAGNADIAFVPAGAFRPNTATPRPANADQAASLTDPTTEPVVVLSLRGDQIMASLERSVSFAPQPSSGFLQVSGLRFSYDPRREGGKRVVSVTVANGQPLDAARTYKVAATKSLAIGGAGYFQIWDKSAVTTETGKTIANAIQEYARSHGNALSPSVDGRINLLSK